MTVSHNPISNLKLGAGIAPVPGYLAAGVALALGTDSMASNNSADLFEEIKMGALLQRGVHHDPALVSGVDTLAMATSGGARALGDGLSGRLAVGEAGRPDPAGHRRTDRHPDDRTRWRFSATRPAAATSPTCSSPVAGCSPTGVLTTLDEDGDPRRRRGAGGQDPRRAGA